MNPATPQVCQAAVMRGSVRESQLLPSGPEALYAPPNHGVTAMSLNETALALSRQVKSRRDEPELWLPKYMTSRAPGVQRSEPFEVVVSATIESKEDIERYAEAGATTLIVSPWARSSGAIEGIRAFAERYIA